MSMGINLYIASGNLGSDIQKRQTPSGKDIGSFSMAVKSGYGEHEKTNWITVKVFSGLLGAIGDFLKKGTKVTVVGEIEIQEWETGGVKHTRVVVAANEIELQSKPQQQQATQSKPAYQPAQQQVAQQTYNQPPANFDDDIPF